MSEHPSTLPPIEEEEADPGTPPASLSAAALREGHGPDGDFE